MRSAYLRYEHKHTTIDSIVKHTKNPRSAPRTRTGRGLAADASSKFTRVYIGCRHTTSAFLTRPPVSQLPPQRQLLSSQVRRFAYANEPPFQFFLFTASSAFIEKFFSCKISKTTNFDDLFSSRNGRNHLMYANEQVTSPRPLARYNIFQTKKNKKQKQKQKQKMFEAAKMAKNGQMSFFLLGELRARATCK